MTDAVEVLLSPRYTVDIVLSGPNGTLAIGTDAPGLDLLLSPIYRGDPGPRGDKGDKGDRGDSGSPGGTTYEHDQMMPSTLWAVTHGLGRFPAVAVVDSANSIVDGVIAYVDNNHLTITFSVPFAGKAYLN